MIRGVHVSVGAPPAFDRDQVTLTVVGDPETIRAIAEDLASRMLGQPAAVPEPDTRTMDGMADGKALSVTDLIGMRTGTTVWARPFTVERRHRVPVRWRKLDTGRWQCGEASVYGKPGVTSGWLVDNRGPVTLDRPPPEDARSDDAVDVDGTPDDG